VISLRFLYSPSLSPVSISNAVPAQIPAVPAAPCGRTTEIEMLDIIVLVIGGGLFGLALLYVTACEKL
jgi:hypothetical protein